MHWGNNKVRCTVHILMLFNESNYKQFIDSEIDEAIVSNFAKNFWSAETFLTSGIRAMAKVLREDGSCEESFMRKVFMLHASKADAVASDVSNLFVKCAIMSIHRETDNRLDEWRNFAKLVIKNNWAKLGASLRI